jgi:DNA-binding NarL/FixJ family response regulator
MGTSATTLVGRDHELRLLQHSLGAMSGGASCQVIVLTGEAGIGKSSLLSELVSSAQGLGYLALSARAAEFEPELPFGLVVDALEEYLQSVAGAVLTDLDGEDLGALGRVFPTLRELDAGSDQPSSAAERFRVHRAVRQLIERLASRQPLVLVLDDVHWADRASLELVEHLLRRPPDAPVLIAIAHRSGRADPRLLGAVEAAAREDLVEAVELGPLKPAEVATMLAKWGAGGGRGVFELSGGNPFYALELARAESTALGLSGRLGTATGVPAAVATSIAGELGRFSESGQTVARSAAIAGDPFELDLALEISGVTQEDGLAALDELIAGDLLRPTNVPRRFRFRHPLVRQAVYESFPPGARLIAHERCAKTLARRGAPAADRAHHVEQSARPGDPAAVAVLQEAGDSASTSAPASAQRWFEAVLRLLPGDTPPDDRQRVLLALAEVQAATGEFERSRASLLECIALAEAGGSALEVGLITACAGTEQLLGRHEEARTRLTSALGQVADTAAPEAVELMLHLAAGDIYRMDYDGMRGWGERALAASLTLDDPPLVAASNAVLAVACAVTTAVPEAQAYRSEAAALLDSLSDDELGQRIDALTNLSTAELYLHRYDEAGEHAKRGLAIGHATGQGGFSPILLPVLSNVLHMRGHIEEATELLDGAVGAARLLGNEQALGWNLLGQSFAAVAAGDLKTATSAAEESVAVTRGLDDSLVSTFASLALADASFESGDPGRAIDIVLTAAGGAELPLIPGGWRANYFELLTQCWLDVGRPAEAGRAADLAADVAADTGLPFVAAIADRTAAAIALQKGDAADAAKRALAAATAAEGTGALVDASRARTLAGRALAVEDRDRAIAELERAVRELEAYGAVRYRQEAERELRKLGQRVHRQAPPAKLDGSGLETLTKREAEIAQLVVSRSTNAEIAAELFLSVKTVETHMRNIFRKLDVASRADVARTVEAAAEPSGEATAAR